MPLENLGLPSNCPILEVLSKSHGQNRSTGASLLLIGAGLAYHRGIHTMVKKVKMAPLMVPSKFCPLFMCTLKFDSFWHTLRTPGA